MLTDEQIGSGRSDSIVRQYDSQNRRELFKRTSAAHRADYRAQKKQAFTGLFCNVRLMYKMQDKVEVSAFCARFQLCLSHFIKESIMTEYKFLRPSPTALLNPRCDPSFKAMFTQNTLSANAALADFISAMTGRTVTHVELTANEPAADLLDELQMSFDVGVTFDG